MQPFIIGNSLPTLRLFPIKKLPLCLPMVKKVKKFPSRHLNLRFLLVKMRYEKLDKDKEFIAINSFRNVLFAL